MDLSTVLRVKTVHISSPILAAKSPFFYKVNVPSLVYAFCIPWFLLLWLVILCIFLQLFSNGMRESEQRYVTLRIHASGNCSNMWKLVCFWSDFMRKRVWVLFLWCVVVVIIVWISLCISSLDFGQGSVVNSFLKKGSVMHLKPIYWSLIWFHFK